MVIQGKNGGDHHPFLPAFGKVDKRIQEKFLVKKINYLDTLVYPIRGI